MDDALLTFFVFGKGQHAIPLPVSNSPPFTTYPAYPFFLKHLIPNCVSSGDV